MINIVKINFFQKAFDTNRRNFLFNWNQGDYVKYLKNRIQWYLYPNLHKVSAFPLHLDVETAATCNLRCPMCASRFLSQEAYKNYGKIDVNLFQKIINEAADNNLFSIRLSWRGEVLTHPKILDLIHYAKIVKKIPQISFLTNGYKLKGDIARALIEYGVDYISVSVDGLEGMYEKIRKPLKFNDLYQNLLSFIELRNRMNRKKPQVRITTLWPAIARDPQAFYRKMNRVSDKIVYNPLKDYNIKTQDRIDFKICQFLYERLFISWDGKVHPCSNTTDEFVIGDLSQNSISEVWHGEKLNRLRKTHENGRRLQIFPCNECSYGVDYEKRWQNKDWSKWDPDELKPEQPVKINDSTNEFIK